MASNVTRLRAFGKELAKAQDAALLRHASWSEARERLLAPRSSPRDARSWQAWAAWIGLAAALGAAAYLAFGPVRSTSMAFDIGPVGAADRGARGERGERGKVGDWIAAPSAELLPIRFSDGSVFRLVAGSRARVVALTSQGARVVLEGGGAHADVAHRDGARWDVQAGPFEVHVRGTAFDVAWDPAHEVFRITLEQGSVTISGCSLPGERTVAKGETFRAQCKEGGLVMLEPTPTTSPPVGTVAPPPSPTSAAVLTTKPTTLEGVTVDSAAAPTPLPFAGPVTTSVTNLAAQSTGVAAPPLQWHDLFLARRYDEAIRAADAIGLSSICASTDAASLVELSDAARFAGHADDAEVVLRAVRKRFPDDERASVAAFHLGRIAFDNRGSCAEAAQWFQVYLRERPQGAFSREASGRLIEALDRSDDHAGAKEAARRYLLAFPTGPHAETARSLAGR